MGILKNNASKREDDESMVDSLPVSLRLSTYLKDSFYSESLGDFRQAKCLHCDKLVRRGKPGCTARETTNSGMASHMRTKHSGSPGPDAGRRWEGCQDGHQI